MASFLGKLRSGNDTKNAANASPLKKDPNAPQPTPLERMLENAGPIRNDGSDKFFGMENFGNTCYCNSILQCLYYTPPFRENVLSYPQRSTPESLAAAAATATPRPQYRLQNGVLIKPGQVPPAKAVVTPAAQPGQKPDDKDSPEYKKKVALAAGPIVNMTYENAAGYDMPESMFTSLKDIFEAVAAEKNRHGVISPGKFLEVLRRENEMFRSAMHQDAHEFLNLLLNSIIDGIEDHEKKLETVKNDIKHEGENGHVVKPANGMVSWPSTLPLATTNSRTKWLREMFEGTSTSETRCLTCETVSHRDEPFLDLSVDLEQHSSVTACLNRYSEEEMLCERNKFHCDNCGGLQEAEKRMKIKRLPQILALHLKRFKYTEDLARLQKLHHKVVYPYHLRLFNTTNDAEDPDRLYELYAVVVHIGGGPYHGHYVAIIKTQDRGWLLFDDEMVEPVDRSYVKNFFGDKSGLATAYVLFYRQTTEEEMRKEQQMTGKRRASQDLVAKTANRATESAEIHRVYSASPSLPPLETGAFGNLDSTLAAAHTSTNGHSDVPKSPVTGLNSSSPTQTKREKGKEEKERKAAEKATEKEREKAEKQRKKDLEIKLKDAQKKQQDDLKVALDASKNSKDEEDKRNGNTENSTKENTPLSSLTSRDLFRRSKSLRFGSLGRKDKNSLNSTSTADDPAANTAIEEESTNVNGNSKEKDKRNRFSIRKKSFGML